MYLIFDTETTGLPKNFKAPITDTDNWPRCIQIAWQLHDDMGNLVEAKDYMVKPDGFTIPFGSEQIHGISTALATEEGYDLDEVLDEFNIALTKAKFIIGQNLGFDVNIMGCELFRREKSSSLLDIPVLDTCTETTANLCKIPGGRGGKFKLPNLTELHEYLFQQPFAEAHNATADVEATTRCFFELIRLRIYTGDELGVDENYFKAFINHNPSTIQKVGLKHNNLKKASAQLKEASDGISATEINENLERLKHVRFSQLHNHSQYSILQATTEINALIAKAAEHGSPAVALTDLGNLMAAYHFLAAGDKYNKGVKSKIAAAESAENPDPAEIEALKKQLIKPILGCDFFICQDRTNKTVKDVGYSVPLLAKNKAGYHNLAKMASTAYIDGFYYVPRIDKGVVEAHKGDLIALSGGIKGEIPDLILNKGETQAEEAFLWWKEQFGDDFYVELFDHGLEEEKRVNEVLIRFARKHDVKMIASNNSFYLTKEDADAHDILLCVKEGEKKSTPIGRGRGFRYGFPNHEFYFKSPDEMKQLFAHIPEAIENTNEIVDKIETYVLAREVLLPKFDIPEQFQDARDEHDDKLKIGENAFLKHLTYEGAARRYEEITPEIKERLDFELATIQNTGYPGYFLIVQDFCQAARDMGVSVGPGRGSAAGSAVAYCLGITNVDPIKYDLLFERFLNPDRVSLPDIDIDFDDEGRQSVIDFVIDKYGANHVAQIITYGTMAAKSAIRDCGRVLDLPLPETDKIAKLVPDTKLKKLFSWDEKTKAAKLSADQIEMADQLFAIKEQENLEGEVLRQAHTLEGSVRNTGIHACGVIITPTDIREIVPVAVAKDSEMWNTQFDNSVVEDAGLLKMDFLGLKTLTLIKDTLRNVKKRHDIEIDIEEIPLDDEETYALFQRGETVGIFQYESPGMQKHMKSLKPTVFADLIAMNALYRPGPIEYIPSFIARKHGEEEIVYDVEACSEYLEETYGITVYQEQVMLLSQSLADFTKGEADTLRKAMGKKKLDLLAQLKPKFLDQGAGNGHDRDKLEKIWKDWEAFASYAFNKSHSTCYAWIAYQTAYLKAHYPAEYMAACLTNNMHDMTTLEFFLQECQRMGVKALGPDVNESESKFTVNDEGVIRFGLNAVKGVGGAAVDALLAERAENGPFKSIFDVTKRVNLRSVNKKCLENLIKAGGFDRFGAMRSQYFYMEPSANGNTLERAIKYGHSYQAAKDSAQQSLFGATQMEEISEPALPNCEPWTFLELLKQEKEVTGMYILGHPLDEYKLEIEYFTNATMADVGDVKPGVELKIAGVITEAAEPLTKRGDKFGRFTVEDYNGGHTFFLFGEDYLQNRPFLVPETFVLIKGKFEPRWRGSDNIEFKVKSMELLSEVRDKMAKGIEMNVDLAEITPTFVKHLGGVLESHPGTYGLNLFIWDREYGYDVPCKCKNFKVDISNEFIAECEAIDGLRLKVKT